MSENIFRRLSKKLNCKINELDANGRKWIGYDGLLNMETFALITLFFMIFLKPFLSSLISLVIGLVKCYNDYKNGHKNEKHDLICIGIGIIFGCIIGIALAI